MLGSMHTGLSSKLAHIFSKHKFSANTEYFNSLSGYNYTKDQLWLSQIEFNEISDLEAAKLWLCKMTKNSSLDIDLLLDEISMEDILSIHTSAVNSKLSDRTKSFADLIVDYTKLYKLRRGRPIR